MPAARRILICCALPEEARPLQRRLRGDPGVRLQVTGMGRVKAVAGLHAAWRAAAADLVLTAGLAGGLAPAWQHGAVLYAVSPGCPLEAALRAAGASPARFHCADRMVITAEEKRLLREQTGADAVEMESGAIQAACVDLGVPCATVRAISDAAGDDLPLDFNRFQRKDGALDMVRLLGVVARSPRLVGSLLGLRRQARAAALSLATVLARAMRGLPG
jgi:nucleoside phosphorylase